MKHIAYTTKLLSLLAVLFMTLNAPLARAAQHNHDHQVTASAEQEKAPCQVGEDGSCCKDCDCGEDCDCCKDCNCCKDGKCGDCCKDCNCCGEGGCCQGGCCQGGNCQTGCCQNCGCCSGCGAKDEDANL